MDLRALKLEVYRICAGLARVPPSQRLARLRREIENLPDDCREIALSLVTTTLLTTEVPVVMQTWEKMTMIAAGLLFLLLLTLIALWVPEPSGFQVYVFRVVLSLAGAAFVCALPGLLHVQGRMKSWVVRAGGSLGMFVLIYTINPPGLVTASHSAESTEVHSEVGP